MTELLSNTPGGTLLVFALVVPAAGLMLAFLAGGRAAMRVAFAVVAVQLGLSIAIARAVWDSGAALIYLAGGWRPPLGIALRADGISAAMMVMTAIVLAAVALYARTNFSAATERRADLTFWCLLIALSGAMNAVFLGNDLFNLYVALELLTFVAVPLVCLDGKPATLQAALRYLLFALIGSVLYLLGVALFYGAYAALDITLLRGRIHGEPAAYLAVALMTAGLLAKTALFPLHLWLPPAHADAPPAASAVLSALVVKAKFFLILRLWFALMPTLAEGPGADLLGALGAGAILFGSALALRQARLKLLIAYSTLAQLGYLFLMIPLATGPVNWLFWSAGAWTGGMFQAIAHGFAKAAMFLAAGLMAEVAGHDRIAGLAGIGRALPVATLGFALGGLSLLGVPPSGGFLAKWLLLTASIAEGQWWWAVVMLIGGAMAGGYIFRVLANTLADSPAPLPVAPRGRQYVVLALALCSLALGLLPAGPSALLQIGRVGP